MAQRSKGSLAVARTALAFALTYLMVWGGVPAPALAEVAGEAQAAACDAGEVELASPVEAASAEGEGSAPVPVEAATLEAGTALSGTFADDGTLALSFVAPEGGAYEFLVEGALGASLSRSSDPGEELASAGVSDEDEAAGGRDSPLELAADLEEGERVTLALVGEPGAEVTCEVTEAEPEVDPEFVAEPSAGPVVSAETGEGDVVTAPAGDAGAGDAAGEGDPAAGAALVTALGVAETDDAGDVVYAEHDLPKGGVGPEDGFVLVPVAGEGAGVSVQEDDGRSLEQVILSAVARRVTGMVDVERFELTTSELRSAYHSVVDSYPELFDAGSCVVWYYPSTGLACGFEVSYSPGDLDDAEALVLRGRMREAVADAMSWVPGNGTDLQKVKAARDWLAHNVSYDYDAAGGEAKWYSYSAYGALVERNCVCSGYARAFKLLMDLLGIPCTYVSAHNHAWNRVEVDGSWYHVDSTWGRGYNTTWFMRSDEGIREQDRRYSSYYLNDGEITHADYDLDAAGPAGDDARYDDWTNEDWRAFWDEPAPLASNSVESFSLSSQALFLPEGGVAGLSVSSIAPSGTNACMAVWSSSNESVATALTGGMVLAGEAPGTATVTCTIGGVSRSCKVYVGMQAPTTTYGGVDWSPVYDPEWYVAHNADVARAFTTDGMVDYERVLAHFVNHGQKEGRQGNASFVVRAYRARNLDLQKAFGNDLTKYYRHYVTNGRKEGRDASALPTTYGGLDWSAVYDPEWYASHNADVLRAYTKGNRVDYSGILAHFVNHGQGEGRQACASFDVWGYRARHLDLQRVFGADLARYYRHYVTNGRKEGRDASALPTTYGGVDWSAVYDPLYYTSANADVLRAYTKGSKVDYAKVLAHFVAYGQREGRRGSVSFDVGAYRARYLDLQRAFGTDLTKYYRHYVTNGKKEGRDAGALPTTYGGVDWSAVYDPAWYAEHNADVARWATTGNKVDFQKVLQHFVTSGQREGRQSSATFSAKAYRARYADLQRLYRNDYAKYYWHFVTSGEREGRSGRP